jgi:Type ISP C-terminal specificity domain
VLASPFKSKIHPEFSTIATPSVLEGANTDWRVTAGWGNRSEKGVVMPSRGRLNTRTYTAAEIEAQKKSALFGGQTYDVWINAQTYWRNVPDSVWEFHIGSYQVLKKWLGIRRLTADTRW